MMNPGDILKTRLATPEQVELVRVAIREELSKFSGEGFGERERIYDLRRFFRFNNPDIRTDLIATTIFDAVTGAVGFTDTEAEWFSRDIYAFIHHELIKLLGRGEKNCWLESHSLLRRCPDDSPTLRFSELKLDAGPSALLFSHMDGETCQRLARTNHYYDKAISAHLGAVVRSSLRPFRAESGVHHGVSAGHARKRRTVYARRDVDGDGVGAPAGRGPRRASAPDDESDRTQPDTGGCGAVPGRTLCRSCGRLRGGGACRAMRLDMVHRVGWLDVPDLDRGSARIPPARRPVYSGPGDSG